MTPSRGLAERIGRQRSLVEHERGEVEGAGEIQTGLHEAGVADDDLHALGDLLLEPLLAVLRRDARAERLSLVPALGEDARQATGDIVALRVGHEDEHAPVHRGLLFDDLEQHPILGIEVIER